MAEAERLYKMCDLDNDKVVMKAELREILHDNLKLAEALGIHYDVRDNLVCVRVWITSFDFVYKYLTFNLYVYIYLLPITYPLSLYLAYSLTPTTLSLSNQPLFKY